MNPIPTQCVRCGAEFAHTSSTMSKFNTDHICAACKTREVAHPAYAEADRAEFDAVRRGDANFAGIGAPAVLYQRPCKAEEFIVSVRQITGTAAQAARAKAPSGDPAAAVFRFPDGSLVEVAPHGRLRVLAYA